MSVNHHPGEELLLDYAGGAAAEAVALIVATHLAFCAECRDAVVLLENLGGAMLEDMPLAALRPDALAAVMASLEARPAPQPAPSADHTPAPLRAFMGRDLSQVRWRRMGPRLAYAPLSRRRGVAARLLRGAPGTDVGQHSHGGQEYTLVLAGGFTDATGTYGPGDFQAAGPGLSHHPIADDDGDCVNLAVTTAPLRFEGLIQRVAGKLFGF